MWRFVSLGSGCGGCVDDWPYEAQARRKDRTVRADGLERRLQRVQRGQQSVGYDAVDVRRLVDAIVQYEVGHERMNFVG